MYLGHRSRGIYAVIEDEAAKEKLRREWAGSNSQHLIVEWPPDWALCVEEQT